MRVAHPCLAFNFQLSTINSQLTSRAREATCTAWNACLLRRVRQASIRALPQVRALQSDRMLRLGAALRLGVASPRDRTATSLHALQVEASGVHDGQLTLRSCHLSALPTADAVSGRRRESR